MTVYDNPSDATGATGATGVTMVIFFDPPQLWKVSISSPNCEIADP